MLAASKTFFNGTASSPSLLIARPTKIETITKAIILSLDKISLKSLTLIAWTVLSKIFNSTSSFSASPKVSTIASESLGFTN